MCMNNDCGKAKMNSYVPKSMTKTQTSAGQAKAMKGWAGAGGSNRGAAFGTPKIRMSFSKR